MVMESTHKDESTATWISLPQASQACPVSLQKFLEVAEVLLERPNLNSTHLFRADILYDSLHRLETIYDKNERHEYQVGHLFQDANTNEDKDRGPSKVRDLISSSLSSTEIKGLPAAGLQLTRTVVRKLIPRKPQVDNALEQSCFIYQSPPDSSSTVEQASIIYVPCVTAEDQMPWYHPSVRALAYVYTASSSDQAEISMHFLPFQENVDTSLRLERTLQSIASTTARLMRMPSRSDRQTKWTDDRIMSPELLQPQSSTLRDAVLPQHIVQDTYTRLKQTYAADLIGRWIEKTEPSKHVFEDLSIAAFLIELWKTMYCKDSFPGFVDIACGNGVLVYILLKEGYQGKGFDARRRKTWEILGIEDHLEEQVCVPEPFLDATSSRESDDSPGRLIHNGIFQPGTFIVSNHADELTPWTPILAALSCPGSPLPFLAIPCCSHALDGSRHRYTLKEVAASRAHADKHQLPTNGNNPPSVAVEEAEEEEQARSGDLKALRAAKAKTNIHDDDRSMYACLTKKTVALAEEVGFEVEQTLMRIPSTRNVGIIGNRKQVAQEASAKGSNGNASNIETAVGGLTITEAATTSRIHALIERECVSTGGLNRSAETWIEKTKKLNRGQGRGKVNWKLRNVNVQEKAQSEVKS